MTKTPTLLVEEIVNSTLTSIAALDKTPVVAQTPIPLSTQLSISLDRMIPGLTIAYTKDGNLWLWTEIDGITQLTSQGTDFRPILSPDGQWIAFERRVDEYHSEIWALSINEEKPRQLVGITDLDKIGGGVRDTNSVAIVPYQFNWVPGTHLIVFNSRQVFQGQGFSLLEDINLVNADSSEISYLYLAGWGGNIYYSPNGLQIAISTPSKIILARPDLSDYRLVLSFEAVITYSEYQFYAQPSWSSDGRFFRVAIPPVDPLGKNPPLTTLWEVPSAGTAIEQLGSLEAVPFFDTPVRFSPDLSHIIYIQESAEASQNIRTLMISRFDGNNASKYYESWLLQFEGWAPDSTHFIFHTGDNQETWLGGINEDARQFPGDSTGIQDIQWVDSEHILYLKQESEGFILYLADLGGGKLMIDSILDGKIEYDFVIK